MTVESGGTSPVLLLGALIGLIGLAVVVFVVVLGILRGQSDKQEGAAQRSKRHMKQQPGAVPEGAPESEPEDALAPTPGALIRQGEVMRVLRDPESGRVLVEVGGRRYEHIREIEDAQVGRRILWTIADLIRFTGGMATKPQAVRSAAQEVTWEEATSGPASDRAAAWRTPAPADAGVEVLPAKLAQTMSEFFRRGLGPMPADSTRAEPGSFIEQIEAILQERIQALDAAFPHKVHVSEAPDQRLQILVGREVYGSVDEVPDPQVRALIRAAVVEWEQR